MPFAGALAISLMALTGSDAALAKRAPVPPPVDMVKPVPRMRRPPPPRKAVYKVDLIGEQGQRLQVYRRAGVSYVLGSRGMRYSIRVSNPSNRRAEAVVSVDGLDVIDGRSANYRKRGYVIPAFGQVKIDGFRTSTQNVATFRFSSISNSYAGRKGKAARIGVIKVAVFNESGPIMIRPRWNKRRRYYHRGRRRGYRGKPSADMKRGSVSSSRRRPAPRPGWRPHRPRPNPGLGTSFGERRHSSVQYTTFTRANRWTPNFVTTLNYNNYAGLAALGILRHRRRIHIAR